MPKATVFSPDAGGKTDLKVWRAGLPKLPECEGPQQLHPGLRGHSAHAGRGLRRAALPQRDAERRGGGGLRERPLRHRQRVGGLKGCRHHQHGILLSRRRTPKALTDTIKRALQNRDLRSSSRPVRGETADRRLNWDHIAESLDDAFPKVKWHARLATPRRRSAPTKGCRGAEGVAAAILASLPGRRNRVKQRGKCNTEEISMACEQ